MNFHFRFYAVVGGDQKPIRVNRCSGEGISLLTDSHAYLSVSPSIKSKLTGNTYIFPFQKWLTDWKFRKRFLLDNLTMYTYIKLTTAELMNEWTLSSGRIDTIWNPTKLISLLKRERLIWYGPYAVLAWGQYAVLSEIIAIMSKCNGIIIPLTECIEIKKLFDILFNPKERMQNFSVVLRWGVVYDR